MNEFKSGYNMSTNLINYDQLLYNTTMSNKNNNEIYN